MAADVAHGAETAAHGADHASGGFPPFDVTLFPHQLVWLAISFGVLYFLMSRVALPRVTEVVETRAKTVQADLDAAAAESAAAEAAKTDAEKRMADARAGARKIVDDMRTEMNAALAGERAKAEEVLAQRVEAAQTRIQQARQSAMADVDQIAADLSAEIVQKLVSTRARELVA